MATKLKVDTKSTAKTKDLTLEDDLFNGKDFVVTPTSTQLIRPTYSNIETDWSPSEVKQMQTPEPTTIRYNDYKGRQSMRDAQRAANIVGLGLGATGLSVAAAPLIGKAIVGTMKSAPMFLDAMWNPGNYLSYISTEAAPYLNATTHAAGYYGATHNLYNQVKKDRSKNTTFDNIYDAALASVDVALLGNGLTKVVPQIRNLASNISLPSKLNKTGSIRTSNEDLNKGVAEAFVEVGQPVKTTTDMFGKNIPDAKYEWTNFIKQQIRENKNFGKGAWHIDNINNKLTNNILTDGRGNQFTWWDVSPDLNNGYIGSFLPNENNIIYFFPAKSNGFNVVMDSPHSPYGHANYKSVGPIDITEAVKYKWNGTNWTQYK